MGGEGKSKKHGLPRRHGGGCLAMTTLLLRPLSALSVRMSGLFRHAEFESVHVNLSSRYRPYVVPLRLLLMLGCVLISLAIFWNAGQAALEYWTSLSIQ